MNGEPTSFHQLAWRVTQSLPDVGVGRTILVTSARRGEGRSYIATALAAALGEQIARPIALCDCSPAPQAMPSIKHSSSVAEGNLTPLVVRAPDVGAVSGGQIVPIPFGRGGPATLFHGSNVKRALELLRADFGFVVVDGPVLADCGALSAATDGTLLVVNSERTRREIVKGSLQSNPHVRQKMLGVVLNELPRYIPNWVYRHAL